MKLRSALKPECIQADFNGKTKDDVLHAIAELAVKSSGLKDVNQQTIYDALKTREELGSTGFGKAIAIPHCLIPNIDEFTVGVLTSKKGINFDSLDGKKTKVFVFIVGPDNKRTDHIQILSSISKALIQEETIAELVKCNSSEELFQLFVKDTSPQEKELEATIDSCLFTVVIQDEYYFTEILKLFSAEVPGDITILEASNAGRYLHAMPLFAAYWNDTPSNFNRVILAVVDKRIMNDLIRRIHTLMDREKDGVLISVQDMIYSWGKLDF